MIHRQQITTTIPLTYSEYRSSEAKPESPTLFILHGLFGMADNWHSVAQGLVEVADRSAIGLRILSFDMPGHGQSGRVQRFDYVSMAAALKPAIETLATGPRFLLGHSMGGKAALCLAACVSLECRVALDGLIVVDIVPKPYPDGHSAYFEAMRRVADRQPASRREADEILAETLDSQLLRAFFLKNWSRDSETGWTHDLDGLERSYPAIRGWDVQTRAFDGAALWIFGEQSEYFAQSSDGPVIQELAPYSQIVTIPQAGHWVHAEQRESFLEAVWQFLAARIDG